MILKVYVIYDKVSGQVHSQLMTSEKDELMIRTLKTAKLGDIVEQNLSDFELHQVATLDTERPSISGLDIPKFIVNLGGIK